MIVRADGRQTVAGLLPVLRPAQVLLVRRTGWISTMIAKVTASEWSHVALVAFSGEVVILIESTTRWKGVAAVKIETTIHDPTVSAWLLRDRTDLTEDDRRRIVNGAWLQSGDPYDHWVNLDVLWKKVTGLPGVLDRRHAKNCAELVRRSFKLGWGLVLDPDEEATPEALARTVKLVDCARWP